MVGVEAQAAGLPCLVSDRVTQEAQLTGNFKFMPLAAGAEHWAKEIVSAGGGRRRDASGELREAGFDIVQRASSLQEYYKSAVQQLLP